MHSEGGAVCCGINDETMMGESLGRYPYAKGSAPETAYRGICVDTHREETNIVREIGKEAGIEDFVNHVHKVAGKEERANIYQYQFIRTGKDTKESVSLCAGISIELTRKI